MAMSVALHAILVVGVVRTWPRAAALRSTPPKLAEEVPVEVELWSPPERLAAVGPLGEPAPRIAVRDSGRSHAVA
ncbi:MAG TPA: hypothetical protein VFQ65_14560, partial [Kofleriaceae bacterium]|nr:hypothetical protein [Kofleriaceae bacterium]